jgi:hypothetical protein
LSPAGVLTRQDDEQRPAHTLATPGGSRSRAQGEGPDDDHGSRAGLRWCDVDLEGGVLHVVQQYAVSDRAIKATKGRRARKVPVGATPAAELRAHRLRTGLRDGLLFGAGDVPLDVRALQERADDAWATAGVARVTPHVCRHLYATLMAAAAVPMHALSRLHGPLEHRRDLGQLRPPLSGRGSAGRGAAGGVLAGAAAATPAAS